LREDAIADQAMATGGALGFRGAHPQRDRRERAGGIGAKGETGLLPHSFVRSVM